MTFLAYFPLSLRGAFLRRGRRKEEMEASILFPSGDCSDQSSFFLLSFLVLVWNERASHILGQENTTTPNDPDIFVCEREGKRGCGSTSRDGVLRAFFKSKKNRFVLFVFFLLARDRRGNNKPGRISATENTGG